MFSKALTVCSHAMHFQTKRLRVISENLANTGSVSETPDSLPYQRKMLLAEQVWDPKIQASLIRAEKIVTDKTPFPQEYRPSHPGANEQGYLKLTNVQSLIELMDMREASQTHSALIQLYQQENMRVQRTIDMMRS